MRMLILYASLLHSSFLFAADFDRLRVLFLEHFWSKYEARKSVENIENFVREAIRQGIDVKGAELVRIQNQGFESYGLISAFQAREKSSVLKEQGSALGYAEIPVNWTSHAFLLVDNRVFDFDFRNQPTILDIGSYINEMFIPKSKHNNTIFRKTRLANYLLNFYLIRPDQIDLSQESSGNQLFIKSRNVRLSDELQDWFSPKMQYGRRCINYYLSISEDRK